MKDNTQEQSSDKINVRAILERSAKSCDRLGRISTDEATRRIAIGVKKDLERIKNHIG